MLGSTSERHIHPARSQAIEAFALLGILLFSIFSRLWKWDGGLTPLLYPAEYSLVVIERILRDGSFWETWGRLFFNFQGQYNHDLAGLFPVDYLAQRFFGLSIELPLFIGCVWGTLSVLAVWWFGRMTNGPLFGITLAALLAVSPLQIVWSRLGMKFEPSVAYCFFTFGIAFLAGRKKNVLLVLFAAALTWGTLYQYYITRIAFAASFLAMYWGLNRAPARLRDFLFYPATLFLSLFCFYFLIAGDLPFSETIWPVFPGVGNYGEKNLADLVFQNLQSIGINAQALFETYFLFNRIEGEPALTNHWSSPLIGGTCLLPIVLFGGFGLIYAIANFRSNFFWLMLTVMSFLPSVMSAASARRLLLFDVCWNAFVAIVVLDVFSKFRSFSFFQRTISILACSGALGVYALYVIGLCLAHLPTGPASIPFSFSLPGDAVTCLRCADASRHWRKEIQDNNVVILVDSDLETLRENPTAPAGLNYYGKLQAISLGKPNNFLELYRIILQNQNFDFPLLDFSQFIRQLKHFASQPNAPQLLWYFERPTQWERWFIEQLVKFGGDVSNYETSLASFHILGNSPFNPALVNNSRGIRVRLPAAQASALISWLEQYFFAQHNPGKITLQTVDQRFPLELPGKPIVIGELRSEGNNLRPQAIPVQARDHLLIDQQDFRGPIWKSTFRESPTEIKGLDEWVLEGLITNHGIVAKQFQHFNYFLNENCGAYANGEWWITDVIGGEIANLDRSRKIQGLRAIGVGRLKNEKLVIATADQKVILYNLLSNKVEREFHAKVQPSIASELDGCTYIRVGKDWIALLNELSNSLHIFDLQGDLLAELDVSEILSAPSRALAIGAHENTLIIADNHSLLYSFALQTQSHKTNQRVGNK